MKTYQGQRLFRVGKLVNTQGLKGELRLVPMTDFPDRFQAGLDFVVESITGEQTAVKLEQARPHKNFLIASFQGYKSINEVEQWKGGELFVTEENLARLEDGEYYFHQLIGMEVLTEDNEPVGVLKDILQTGANDVYVIQRPDKKDLLLPAIDDCIINVDVENNRMIVHILLGLE
jgi:16S rRNA processing protein RimM